MPAPGVTWFPEPMTGPVPIEPEREPIRGIRCNEESNLAVKMGEEAQ